MAKRPLFAAAFLALLPACAGSEPRPVSAPPLTSPSEVLAPLPAEAFPEGPCSGFEGAGKGAGKESLLGGRLTVEPIAGLELSGRPHNIMAAPWAATLETRLFLERDGKKFVVFTEELLSRPGPDLVAAIRKHDSLAADAFVGTFAAGGLQAVAIVPRRLRPDHEKAQVLGLYIVMPDSLVVRMGFFVSPDVVPEGKGCSALARKMAATIAAGARAVDVSGGTRKLEDGLMVDVPRDMVLVPEPGPDFIVYRVYPLAPFGEEKGGLGIYVGHHPRRPGEGTPVPGKLLGSAVDWLDQTEENEHHREAIAEISGRRGGFVHVFFSSPDAAIFSAFEKIASSLRKNP